MAMKIECRSESIHRRVWDAIPWLVNGTAEQALRSAADAHLEQCEDCREELSRQQRLQSAILGDAWKDSGSDAGFALLRARIEAVEEVSRQAAPQSGFRARRSSRLFVGALAATVVIEGVGIALLGLGLIARDAPTAHFRTLSDARTDARHGEIRIVLAPELRIGELAQLLANLQLEVVGGPNEAGAYTLAPRPAARAREDRLARLRATVGVRMVEPIADAQSVR